MLFPVWRQYKSIVFLCLALIATFSSKKSPLIILPGFGNDISDYTDYPNKVTSFASNLSKRGYAVSVVNIKRSSWLNVAKGIFDPSFWSSTCTPDGLFDFYLREVDKEVRRVVENEGEKAVLIGHSAGGWLARAIMGDGVWYDSNEDTADLVSGLVSLGTPHRPPEKLSQDMTRGALTYVDKRFPGAYLKNDIFYLTVAGASVTGNISAPSDSIERFAARSYAQVTGSVSELCIGDGCVPLSAAHLQGAEKLTLEGVYHSINAPGNLWYGGDAVIDRWLPRMESCLRGRSLWGGKQLPLLKRFRL